ncbi:helix-turn-helix transcriptional regulator [uncultured Muribaculum sp.]|uniref:helix-turn-helix domain-containing protein n=1 Tax=uncultured Muribaculum sp. TaxID=1918613 RepID=UPI0025B05350|nr:helix-turn-helix transcriptional regulator [uncultured Muribaculum sp.]
MANLILIRDLCELRKMTIRELAERIGRNESTLQAAIRKGTTNSTTIELIAKELRVPAGYFFDGWKDSSKVDNLTKENEHLRALLAEKERTIAILMSDRNK